MGDFRQKTGKGRRESVNKLYTKTLLYAYPKLTKIVAEIDDVIDRILLTSMENYKPCIDLCEKIMAYKLQKQKIIEIKKMVERALTKLNAKQMDFLDYKYFRLKPKSYHAEYDRTSRAYFRQQIEVIKKMSERFETVGLNSDFFEKECLSIRLFSILFGLVVEQEKKCRKNKSELEKRTKKKANLTVQKKTA